MSQRDEEDTPKEAKSPYPELKRHREQSRRGRLTASFQKLSDVLQRIDPGFLLERTIPDSSGSSNKALKKHCVNRNELLDLAIGTLRSLHQENEANKAIIEELTGNAKEVSCSSTSVGEETDDKRDESSQQRSQRREINRNPVPEPGLESMPGDPSSRDNSHLQPNELTHQSLARGAMNHPLNPTTTLLSRLHQDSNPHPVPEARLPSRRAIPIRQEATTTHPSFIPTAFGTRERMALSRVTQEQQARILQAELARINPAIRGDTMVGSLQPMLAVQARQAVLAQQRHHLISSLLGLPSPHQRPLLPPQIGSTVVQQPQQPIANATEQDAVDPNWATASLHIRQVRQGAMRSRPDEVQSSQDLRRREKTKRPRRSG